MNHKTLLSESEKSQLVAAIKKAEDHTVGEIKVHIDNHCKGDVIEKATSIFDKLKLYDTKERTGVLIYMACIDKKMAILGDKGIHQIVNDVFWNDIVTHSISFFKQEKYYEGLECAVNSVGTELHKHFPSTQNNTNEISNEISFGDEE
jgi:uncharacterized membrane protein